MNWDWQDWSTAPKDREILIRGVWKSFDIIEGGSEYFSVAHWSTVMSNGTGYQWYVGMLCPLDSVNVEITHWCDLKSPNKVKSDD